MKTVIIERGLTEVDFFDKTRPGDIYMYIKALREIGADYIELNLNALFRLPKPAESDNYIYRIETQSDVIIANSLPFAYAVIPLRLSFLIPKIKIPVMLEVCIGKSDPLSLLSVISETVDFSKISLLRLTGDFSQLPDEIAALIAGFRSKYALPIDFLPLNDSLTALSTSVSAYASGADSVTMSFGDSDNCAALEEFAITLATMYKIILNNDFVVGICKAVIISNLFTVIKSDNLRLLMKQYGILPSVLTPREDMIKFILRSRGKKTPYDKLIAAFELDSETNEQVIKILKDCAANLYTDEKNNERQLNQ